MSSLGIMVVLSINLPSNYRDVLGLIKHLKYYISIVTPIWLDLGLHLFMNV